MSDTESRAQLIAWAEDCLRDLHAAVAVIDAEIGPDRRIERLARELRRLERLRGAQNDDRGIEVLVAQAWRQGMAPLGPEGPWLARIATLRDLAPEDPFAYDLLCKLAERLLNRAEPFPLPLADFVVQILRGELTRPGRRGRTRSSLTRDRLLCALIEELHKVQGVKPTRNEATDPADSGCDIVAMAMANLGLSPATYPGVRRIWLNGRKAARQVRPAGDGGAGPAGDRGPSGA